MPKTLSDKADPVVRLRVDKYVTLMLLTFGLASVIQFVSVGVSAVSECGPQVSAVRS